MIKKKRIIYSLTTRGLFSELSNLVLAKIYADFNKQELVVNTYRWNARIDKGWEDYFQPTVNCTNFFMSSQINVYAFKVWIGNIYYKPKIFFQYYISYFFNRLYLLFHPFTVLSEEAFLNMRTKNFIEKDLGGNVSNLLSDSLKKTLKYNYVTNEYIKFHKASIKLPESYIGVHVRRGDKIKEHEMDDISLIYYVNEIKKRKILSDNIFIATDDISVLSFFKEKLEPLGFHIYFNNCISQKGFEEAHFNNKNREERYHDTLNTLVDVDILTHSSFFIGTYSSNVSRIIPLYIGFENSISLDDGWSMLN